MKGQNKKSNNNKGVRLRGKESKMKCKSMKINTNNKRRGIITKNTKIAQLCMVDCKCFHYGLKQCY